ncbi:MAG TPA: SRPBCC family protein [Actinomycetota bacterium]|nr:SRPBCC family protein [Actinomycetota bacterium]
MTVVEATVEVMAPPDRVWAVVSDPRNLPRWDRRVASVEDVPSQGLSRGATYTTVMRFMAVRSRVHAEVLEWDPPERATVRLMGLLEATVSTTVTALPGGRSRLRHIVDYHFPGGALGDLAARSLRVLGGAGFALRHGTLAQVRQIERGASEAEPG